MVATRQLNYLRAQAKKGVTLHGGILLIVICLLSYYIQPGLTYLVTHSCTLGAPNCFSRPLYLLVLTYLCAMITLTGPVVPKYYYVPKEDVEAERASPGACRKIPSGEGQGQNLFLWGQSLYIISELLGKALCVFNSHHSCFLYLFMLFLDVWGPELTASNFKITLTAEQNLKVR